MTEKLKVFISYNHKSKDEANVFRTLLRKLGFDCWFDEDKIKFGEDIKQMMTAGVNECDVMILLITKDYISSKNCLYEAKLAALLNKETIPVLLEKIKWPIMQLGDKYGEYKSYANLYKTIDKNKYRNIKYQLLKNDVLKKLFNQLRDRASNEGKEASKCFQFCWDLELTNECCYAACCVDCCDSSKKCCNDFCFEASQNYNSSETDNCDLCCATSEKCNTTYWKNYKLFIIIDIVIMTIRFVFEIAELALGFFSKPCSYDIQNYMYTGSTFGILIIIVQIILQVIRSSGYKKELGRQIFYKHAISDFIIVAVIFIVSFFVNFAGSLIIGMNLSSCVNSFASFLIGYIILQWLFMLIQFAFGIWLFFKNFI